MEKVAREQSNDLIEINEVSLMLAISRYQLNRLRETERFPAPVRLPGLERGALRWRKSDVLEYIDGLED